MQFLATKVPQNDPKLIESIKVFRNIGDYFKSKLEYAGLRKDTEIQLGLQHAFKKEVEKLSRNDLKYSNEK